MPSVKLVMRREFGQERLKCEDSLLQEALEAWGHRIMTREGVRFARRLAELLGGEVEIEDPA